MLEEIYICEIEGYHIEASYVIVRCVRLLLKVWELPTYISLSLMCYLGY